MAASESATADDETRLSAWEHRTEWPLTISAAVFLGAYAWPILEPTLSIDWKAICRALVIVAWATFVVDYLVRVSLARQRGRYVYRHLPDIAILALPVLRPLRLLRLLALLRMLNRGAAHSLRGRIAIYVSGATLLLLFCSSLAVLDAERGHHGANIQSFGDALWWSATTITTVGYGDHYPTTVQGRWVAAGLMLGGVALLGIVTASIASWLLDRVRESEQEVQAATRADVAALTAEVQALRIELRAALADPTSAESLSHQL